MVAGTNGFNTPQRIFNQVIDFGSKWMTGSTAKKTEVADEPPAQVSNDTSHESLMALVTQSRARDSPETMFHGGLIPPLYLHLGGDLWPEMQQYLFVGKIGHIPLNYKPHLDLVAAAIQEFMHASVQSLVKGIGLEAFYGAEEMDKLYHGVLISAEGLSLGKLPAIPPPTLKQHSFGFKESDTGVVYHLSGYLEKCLELVPGDPTSQRRKITTYVYPLRDIQDTILQLYGMMLRSKKMGYEKYPGDEVYNALELGSPIHDCRPTGEGSRPDSRVVSEHTSEDGISESGSQRASESDGTSEIILRRIEEHATSLRPDWEAQHPDDTVHFETIEETDPDVTVDREVPTQDRNSVASPADSTAASRVSPTRDQDIFSESASMMTHDASLSPLIRLEEATTTPESQSSHGSFLSARSRSTLSPSTKLIWKTRPRF